MPGALTAIDMAGMFLIEQLLTSFPNKIYYS